MKNFLFMLILLSITPVCALCPIEGGESVCSLPNFREKKSPIYKEINTEANLNNPQVQLQPLKRENPLNNMREPNNKLNYNSGCQFGICVQDLNNTINNQ